jgi:hypothetical protein
VHGDRDLPRRDDDAELRDLRPGDRRVIPFDPAVNRVLVRFEEGTTTRSATNVAVRTQ